MTDDLLYGRQAVLEVIRAGRRQVKELRIQAGSEDKGLEPLLSAAAERGVSVRRVSPQALDGLQANHQGVAAVASRYPYANLADVIAQLHPSLPPLFLLLDVLQDPQNLATLLRSAEAVGVTAVVMPARRSASITPAVVKASAGACEHLLIAQENLAQAIDMLKQHEVWVTGLERSPEARPLAEADWSGAVALVVGGEAEGMRRLVRESCDFLVEIPMRGQVQSLNAASAGTIALYAIWAARGYQGVDSA